jgi:hypothetical protein
MKCHYIYTEEDGKVLIPGCMGTAARGMEYCTCRSEVSFAQFERKQYNDTVRKLRAEIKELEKENNYLNRTIKKLLKTNRHEQTN